MKNQSKIGKSILKSSKKIKKPEETIKKSKSIIKKSIEENSSDVLKIENKKKSKQNRLENMINKQKNEEIQV